MTQTPFVEQLRQQLEEGIPGEVHREKRRRWKVGGAVAALLVALGVSLSVGGGDGADDQIQAGPPRPTTAADVTEEPPAPPLASTLPPSPTRPTPSNDVSIGGQPVVMADLPPPDPGRSEWGSTVAAPPGQQFVTEIPHRYVSAWSGRQLLLYGQHRGELLDPEDQGRWPVGTAYQLDPPQWSELPIAPGAELRQPVGVWTGDELIVCCGLEGERRALAWSPAANTWRTLAPPPVLDEAWVTDAVWAHDRMVVFAGAVVLVYEPALDQWETRQRPSAMVNKPVSVAVIDHRVVVWPRPGQRTTGTGWLFDTLTGGWTELPSPPGDVWPAIPSVAWTGEEVIVMGGLPGAFADASERLVGARLNLETMQWRALPDVFPEPKGCECNLGSQSLLWTGERLIVSLGFLGSGINPFGNLLFAYDPGSDSWWDIGAAGGAVDWGPALIAAENEVALVGSQLVLIDNEVFAGGTEVPASGIEALPSQGYTDLGWRGVPLTLVGANAVGDVVVVDAGSGLRTIYAGASLPWGASSLTDLAMSADSLYAWRHDRLVSRWPSGPGAFDDSANRLVLGQLNQPPEELGIGIGERSLLPSTEGRVWVRVHDDSTVALVDTVTGQTLLERPLDAYPVGTLANGDLVLHTDSSQFGWEGGLLLQTDGTLTEFTSEQVVGVTGNRAVSQLCSDGACSRTVYDLTNPAAGPVLSSSVDSQYRYFTVAGPMWPSNSAPLSAGSPGGRHLLVRRVATDRAIGDYTWVDLAVFDTTTGEVVPVVTAEESPALDVATWSRDGRYVVMISGESDVVTVDLQTGLVARHPGAIPEGYGILAAG